MPKIISDYTKQQIAEMSKHKSITQVDIARAFGVSRATVRTCLTGKKQERKVSSHRRKKDMWDFCPITGLGTEN